MPLMTSDITVYGADWCPMTRRTREHLDELGVPYRYIDIDHDEQGAQWVAEQNDGKEKKPTLNVAGQVMTTPSDASLDRVLRAKGFLHDAG